MIQGARYFRAAAALALVAGFLLGAFQAAAGPTPLYWAGSWTTPAFQNVTVSAGVGAEGSLLNASEILKEKNDGFLNGGRGACVLDFDGDGDDDIYVVGPGKNQLYRNNGAMDFDDVTDQAGVGDTGYGMGCAAADMDNDGDQDMITTSYKSHFSLWRNNGNGTFTNMTSRSGVDDTGPQAGVCIADFDNDGLLDFFIVEYLRTGDRVYRNLGGWKFEDMTENARIADLDHGFQPIAADYDGDGDQDVYVAVDFGPDVLWQNIGNFTFADVSRRTGAYDLRGGMGAAWGDWNNDGDLDVIVTNYDPDGLWDNQNGNFVDVGNATGVDDQWTSWGVVWEDFDLDQDMDLYIVNGVVDYGNAAEQPNKLFMNNGNGTFTDMSAGSGADQSDVKRGAAASDFDGDGRVDLYVLSISGPAALLRNEIPTTNGWLRVKLEGTVSNRDGVGAEVTVRLAGQATTQLVASGSSYLSSNSKTLVFGTGDAGVVPEINVKWPSGLVQTVYAAAANTTITITESDAVDPVARALQVDADQGIPFILNGSASTDNVGIARWDWSVNVSGVVQRTSGKVANMTVYTPGAYTGTLEVTDVFGRKAAADFPLNVRPLLRVTLEVGPDLIVNEGETVQFAALGMSTATPDYEGACSFLWEFNDAAGLQHLFGARPSFTFGLPGVYPVVVRVLDPQNATAQDALTVTVKDAYAPVLHADVPSRIDEDRPFILDASGTTDNDPTFDTTGRFNWTYTTPHGSGHWEGRQVTAAFPDPGPVTLTLVAEDQAGNVATATYLIAVNDTTPPTPNAGPDQTARVGQQVVIWAGQSTDNSADFFDLARFEWVVWTNEGAQEYSGLRQILTFSDPGLFRVELDIWDPVGNHAEAVDIMVVHILDEAAPDAVAGGDLYVEVGERVQFAATGSTDNDPTFRQTGTFLWEFQDGSQRQALTGYEASYVFKAPGNYQVRLTATDASGLYDTDRFYVYVSDDTPPTLVVAPIPPQIASGIAIVMDASGSSDNGGAFRVSWLVTGPLGYQAPFSGVYASAVLTAEGDYTITVSARDNSGNVIELIFHTTVVRPPPAPNTPGGSPSGGGTGGGDGAAPPMGGEGPSGPAGGGQAEISMAGLLAAAAVSVVAWLALRRVRKEP